MTIYELEMEMRLVRGNGSVAQCNYTHFLETNFLNLFKKMDNYLHNYCPDWEINVRFCKIENLHLDEVNFNKIQEQNEKDRSILSEFTTTGRLHLDEKGKIAVDYHALRNFLISGDDHAGL